MESVLITLLILLCPVLLAGSFFTAWRAVSGTGSFHVGSWGMWLGVLLVVGGLLIRPSEKLEAGQDAAAYFNVATWLIQEGSFSVEDPALAELQPVNRKLFRHGPPQFMVTKDHTLWAEDLETMDPVKVYFFPATSLLLAFPMLLGIPYAAFWLNTLVALGCAVLVGLLGRQVTGTQSGGWIAFALFLLHPAVAWNARAVRAEWGASLLLLSALVLWIESRRASGAGSFRAGAVAGGSLGAAMLFHMTAVYVAVPAVLGSLLVKPRRRFQAGWWTGLAAGGGVFLMQLRNVTDPYNLLEVWKEPGRLPLLVLLLVGGGALFGMILWWAKRTDMFPRRSSPTGLGIAVLFALSLTYSFVVDPEGGVLPGLPEWTSAYLSLTDVRGVASVGSWLVLLFGVAGLLDLGFRSSAGRWVLGWLAPASLTIGWMMFYMFETRRMVTFLVPLLTVGSSWLIGRLAAAVAERSSWKREYVMGGCMLILLGSGFWGRTHLFTTWNQKGMYRYYRELASSLETQADFLLGEYTQTTVPLERLSGLPALPVSWDSRSDEEVNEAEKVLRSVVQANPDRRHVLVSPFPGATLPGLFHQSLEASSLTTDWMQEASRGLPREVNQRTRTLHLTRVSASGSGSAPDVYHREFTGSRLGIRGEANRFRNRTMTVSGVRVEENEGYALSSVASGFQALVVWREHPAESRAPGPVHPPGDSGIEEHPLGDHWSMVILRNNPGAGSFSPDRGAVWVVAHVMADGEGRPRVVPLQGEPEEVVIPNVQYQWMRDRGALAVPSPAGKAWVWTLAAHFREHVEEDVELRLIPAEGRAGIMKIRPDWSWTVTDMDFGAEPGRTDWLEFRMQTPYNPGLDGYPEDLGLVLKHLVITVPK